MSQIPTSKIAILADDLTSAADGAAPFVAHGLTARVGRQDIPDPTDDVCAIDVASRSVSAAEAGARMTRFARKLSGSQLMLKTVDSTLRGHVQVEIKAAIEASTRRRVIFAPAFPGAGRTTIDGTQLVNGVPVHLSPYGKDPVHPAMTATLRDLVPSGVDDVLIFDAETQNDLDSHVARIDHPEDVLWVGSPGLATALAKRIGIQTSFNALEFSNERPVLVIIGSANPISHQQALMISDDRATVVVAPINRSEDPEIVLNRLVNDAVKKLATGKFGALIATGGDTMEAILDRTGTRSFTLLGEIEPGFPFGSTEIAGQTVLLGMKAGGFGDDATLRRAVERLSTQVQEL